MPYVRRMASQRTPLYHYRVKDKIVGPICLTDLHALLVSKKILPDTMIREEHSQCWMPLATELRRQERLARLRASAFMLSCRPPKSCLLFYIIALLLLACGVAHSIGREGEAGEYMTLGALRDADVDMFSTVFIGNAQTKVIGGKLVTPRGYRDV